MYAFPTIEDASRVATTLASEEPSLRPLMDTGEAVLETTGDDRESVVVLGGHIHETTMRRAQAFLAEAGGRFVAGTAQSVSE